jgi:hypothetical protein
MNGETTDSIDVWQAGASGEQSVHYVVRHPWEWVMNDLAKDRNMEPVEDVSNLPLAKQQSTQETFSSSTELDKSTHRLSRRGTRSNRQKANQGRDSLRLEVVDNATGLVKLAAHGTSGCFDGLGDKDELVRTFQRCRCEQVQLSPPSILIQWDVTKEECQNLVGTSLPKLKNAKSPSTVAVLKEPMGSQGLGIYFVRTAEEIHQIVDDSHQRASQNPELLEKLIAAKGRIPCWGKFVASLTYNIDQVLTNLTLSLSSYTYSTGSVTSGSGACSVGTKP